MQPGLAVDLQIDDAAVRALVQAAPEALTRRLRQIIEAGAVDIQREMILQAPVGVGGGAGLRGSIRYKLQPARLRAEVAPAVDYASSVEEGSAPHWVSVGPGTPLRAWARLKGINPFAVQNAIAKRGTKPHPFVQPTYDKMAPQIKKDAERGISSLADDLNRGVIS